MSLDQKQILENTRKIAEAAVAMEKSTGVPAEFAAAQCILESGYGANSPGHNPFGIKAHGRIIPGVGTPPSVQEIKTKEFFTDSEATRFKASGKKIEADLNNGQPITQNGKKRYTVWDQFAAYPDLTAAFCDYANLLQTGHYFKPCWDRFLQHRYRDVYLKEMAHVYATDPGYYDKLKSLITGQRLGSALTAARG